MAAGSPLLTSAAPAAGENPTGTSSVTVVVSALACTRSVVKLYFYDVRDKFLQHDGHAFLRVIRPGGQQQVTLPISLPNGEWAVAITQDTNNNDKLDKNFVGIPTEPYAFSNNVRPKLAAPNFDECKFVVSGPKVVNIVMRR
ncbi:MAG: DUF2141 domain-containing protein [Hymenobacter sp.]|nr:DUF2141 domain-containing protein [Hymenobacter sp.]